jgi:hypothetical protein
MFLEVKFGIPEFYYSKTKGILFYGVFCSKLRMKMGFLYFQRILHIWNILYIFNIWNNIILYIYIQAYFLGRWRSTFLKEITKAKSTWQVT